MTIREFIEAYKAKKFMNTKQGVDERNEWIRKKLEIQSYIPFRVKREIAEMIINANIKEVDGIKRYDSIDAYVGFVVASITAHTNLKFEDDPVADYDLLAESGLLPQVIAEFQESHNEIDILLKMALASELEGNNVNILVGKFLHNILQMLDGVGETLKEKLEKLDLKDVLGSDIKPKDMAKLQSFLDRWNK